KHMPALQSIPAELASEPFTKAFAIAEEAALSPEERWLYEGSLKQARIHNAEITAAQEKSRAEGRAEGRAEEKIEIARSMIARGFNPPLIQELTGLTIAELENIKEESR